MVDSSWDNSGLPTEKKRMGTGMKVLLGCGITLLVVTGACVAGGLILGRMIRKDPKGFEAGIEGFAQGLVQKDWDHFRAMVDQLQTDEGTLAVYRANPDLREGYATEGQFLETVRGWRPRLKPLPAAFPQGRRHRRRRDRETVETSGSEPAADPSPSVNISKLFGTTVINCRYPDGWRISATFDGERIKQLKVD